MVGRARRRHILARVQQARGNTRAVPTSPSLLDSTIAIMPPASPLAIFKPFPGFFFLLRSPWSKSSANGPGDRERFRLRFSLPEVHSPDQVVSFSMLRPRGTWKWDRRRRRSLRQPARHQLWFCRARWARRERST
ncbi:hypothetical protein GW17_00019525 [Ensete ventricosum]|nr:hypothetical protein GW17_00019525 [Ensete ventricosum]